MPKMTLFIALFSLNLFSLPEARAYTSTINGLKEIQEKSRIALSAIDREMVAAHRTTTKLTTRDVLANTAEQNLNEAGDIIEDLINKKIEETERIELIDKIIFEISKRGFENLRDTLPLIIDEIVYQKLAIGSSLSGPVRMPTIRFLMRLATALRTLAEPIQNPLEFLENYLQYSSVTNPKALSEFSSTQAYLNEETKPLKILSKKAQ